MKTAAVVPALGIGDALLFMIFSYQLKEKGYAVTTFHNEMHQLAAWFPGQQFALAKDATPSHLASFDCVIVENDNSSKIKEYSAAVRSQLHLYYPTYLERKHGPLHPQDFIFDSHLTMAENCARGAAAPLEQQPRIANGLTPLAGLTFRKHSKRVLIHPTSRDAEKNWHATKFLRVSQKLKKMGFTPVFCVSPQEEAQWDFLKPIVPADLSALAAVIYESGYVIGNDSLAGHLSSNLNIPTLTIANDRERMQLWRPGFKKGRLALPPAWLPNFNPLKLRKNHWQHFISSGTVLCEFKKLVEDYV